MESPGEATFRSLLESPRFVYGAEVVTSRGPLPRGEGARPVELAAALLDDPRIAWVSVTDSPGGAPMLPPDWLAEQFPHCRERIVLHLTCKDMNRNALESAAWKYASLGLRNLLAITGDYPTAGYGGAPEPVFDLDSLGLIALLRAMNAGLEVTDRGGKPQQLPPTDFYVGCVVSPFKRHERELMPQYFKLLRKLAAGARWVIPQLGYDMRKFHEVKLLLQSRGIDAPVIGNVYLLNRTVAQLFHSGRLAGCVVSDELLEQANRYAAGPDRGKAFFRELAAKQLAVFKGLGFAAGYLGGIHTADGFLQVIDLAESYGENDWRDFLREVRFSLPDEFFLFEHDPQTGLADPARINPQYLQSLKKPPRSREATVGYRFSRLVHALAFRRDRALWPWMRRLYAWLDRNPQGLLSRTAHAFERGVKRIGFGCEDCGDCMLPDCAYLCPMAGCAKHSRNGPCGGSRDGRCELDDRGCFWARVYERLKQYGETEQLLTCPVVFRDARLRHTSAWANAYLDRDHAAPKAEPPAGETSGGDPPGQAN